VSFENEKDPSESTSSVGFGTMEISVSINVFDFSVQLFNVKITKAMNVK
jgi:hypothetical protein